MKFVKVAAAYQQLEATTSGNKMREILSSFFVSVPKYEIKALAYLSTGKIASDFEEVNFGMAEKMVVKALTGTTKLGEDALLKLFKKKGDLGLATEEITGKRQGTLSLKEVFLALRSIAASSGSGSQEKKCELLGALLKKASPKEAKYIVRIILGTMRLGAGTMTLLDSLAIAFTGTKVARPKLEHAYNICPDIGIIAETLAINGLAGIEQIDVSVGRPIKMMLASRVEMLSKIKDRISGRFTVEEKYDGERVQIHYNGKKTVLYSRRLENITNQFPEIAGLAYGSINARSYIVEGELVPVDIEGNLLPFQVLMQRRRKYRIEEYRKKVPVCLFLFDLLYINGRSYLHEEYPARHAALERITKQQKNRFVLARQIVTSEVEKAEEFFIDALAHGAEGIIVKSTAHDSIYQAGTRGWLWIKWKKEYSKDMSDTLDLVVVGAFAGKGRRSGSYGALLCGAYNDKTGSFETLCKLGSGFSDKQLNELPKRFKRHILLHKPAQLKVHKLMQPDIWFEPAVVVEVLGAELTQSPVHTCAEEDGQGLALRFPRFVQYRENKNPEQATTSREILDMYKQRTKKRK